MSPEQETGPEVKRFSQEARELLLAKGYVIYELTGKTLRDLYEPEGYFSFLMVYPQAAETPTLKSEVAIDPSFEGMYLPESGNKPLAQQEEMVARFSEKLAESIGGVKAVVGEVQDYAELARLHYEATSQRLWSEDYQDYYRRHYGKDPRYTRTKTVPGPSADSVIQIGNWYKVAVLKLDLWAKKDGNPLVWVTPLVVPA